MESYADLYAQETEDRLTAYAADALRNGWLSAHSAIRYGERRIDGINGHDATNRADRDWFLNLIEKPADREAANEWIRPS